MKTLRFYHFFIAIALLMAACSIGGEVVKITTVEKGTYEGLRDEDLERLDEIKKSRTDKKIDPSLSNVIEETPHFTVAEYKKRFPKEASRAGKEYKVGGLDVLQITVYEEKDLSRKAVKVSGNGYISFPLIGRIRVEGLTTSEIEKFIEHRLAKGQYLLDAHVSVMVTGYNSKRFLVLGTVTKPGSYPLRVEERILDAISKAGGIRRASESYSTTRAGRAGKKGMVVRTQNPDTPKERKIVVKINLHDLLEGRDPASNIYMMDKDMLFIPTAEHFYIIGEVKRPGSYSLPDEEITLVEAISMAGGFTNVAARNRTRIIRVEEGVEKIIQVKVDAITRAGQKIKDVIIQPDDVIVVPESFF
ncbi:polysaccharide biosynthesis/export family protein [Thermodesulfobacteriota bacterium]